MTHPELTVSRAAHSTSEEVASAYVGIVYDVAMIALAERETALKQELAVAQLDNAGLLDILRQLDYTSSPERAERILAYVRDQEHPGRALMAHGLAELSAAEAELALARTVIAAAKKCRACLLSSPDMHGRMVALSSAIHAYDKALKVKSK